jgi:hypothetical protein
MKYYKTQRLFKAANVKFSRDELSAWSYGWWKFVSNFGGTLVFNNHAYSVTTRKHQAKVRALMAEYSIAPDLVIETSYSLDNLHSLEDAEKQALTRAADLIEETKKKGTRASRNAERLAAAVKLRENAEAIGKLRKKMERKAA